jgi:hypothetical protein
MRNEIVIRKSVGPMFFKEEKKLEEFREKWLHMST